MSMIDAYLIHVVTVKTPTLDEYNEPTWASASSRARVEWNRKLVRNVKGEQVVAAARVYLPTSVTPTHEMIFTYGGVDHKIIAIESTDDFARDHWEVWIS